MAVSAAVVAADGMTADADIDSAATSLLSGRAFRVCGTLFFIARTAFFASIGEYPLGQILGRHGGGKAAKPAAGRRAGLFGWRGKYASFGSQTDGIRENGVLVAPTSTRVYFGVWARV